ncbi:hypothetical protein JR316_0006232 [Psilocybe cubensis]|uniref:Uncharacterized protein n=2 Tax=Psilocybe cubensis TaxID=181762 RepID=A0ACB8H126_PSICU|nr:hypothetical protein JR316_0006232 [Psilocybe cubensis]KAH9481705.1 hypothetical protein JR316_0006232 [Psilocybe cubensis]
MNQKSYPSLHRPEYFTGMDILQQNIAPGAFHDSDESCDPPKCHPRTREAVLEKIMQWIRIPDVERESFFMWLYGPAGSGKSAIAHTIAEMCKEAGLLAAAFFFSRNAAGRNDKTRLVATLVYQLALSIPAMRTEMCLALETDPALFKKSLEAQLTALVVRPFQSGVAQGKIITNKTPLLVIVDGLDECEDSYSQTTILNALSTLIHRYNLPFYFLIASRPEYELRRAFDAKTFSSCTMRIALDNDYRSHRDIKVFFEDKLKELRNDHPAGDNLPDYWPYGEHGLDLDVLVEKSSGQFIYASTVIRYVSSHRHWPPDRLETVFGVESSEDDSTPFSDLDALYTHILTAADIYRNKKIHNVLLSLVLRPFGRSTQQTISDIEKFWGYRTGEVSMLLSDLHSIINVPPKGDTWKSPKIAHASMSDFLLNRERSGKFYIDEKEGYIKLAVVAAKHLNSSSRPFETSQLVQVLYEACSVDAKAPPELFEQLHVMDPTPIFQSKSNFPELICWMAKQCHPSYTTSIVQRHKARLDQYFLEAISKLPAVPWTKKVLTAMSLPEFVPSISPIFKILQDELPGPQGVDPEGYLIKLTETRNFIFPFSRSTWKDRFEYCAMYSEFQKNYQLPESFVVRPTDYSVLAQSVWKFIRRRHYLEHDNPESWALNNYRIPVFFWAPNSLQAKVRTLPGEYCLYGELAFDLLSALLKVCPPASDDRELVTCLRETVPMPWGSEADPLLPHKIRTNELISNYLGDLI